MLLIKAKAKARAKEKWKLEASIKREARVTAKASIIAAGARDRARVSLRLRKQRQDRRISSRWPAVSICTTRRDPLLSPHTYVLAVRAPPKLLSGCIAFSIPCIISFGVSVLSLSIFVLLKFDWGGFNSRVVGLTWPHIWYERNLKTMFSLLIHLHLV